MASGLLGESELLERARAGSAVAFSQLVQLHQQPVRRFLARVCGSRDLADDLAQETFVAAWSGLARYGGQSSFRSWLCGIAYRKALSHTRSLLRTRRREAESLWPEALDVGFTGLEDRLALAQALERLPVDQRAALALCYGAGFSHAEVAATLGVPLGTLKSHVLRGRARMLEMLRIDDDDR